MSRTSEASKNNIWWNIRKLFLLFLIFLPHFCSFSPQNETLNRKNIWKSKQSKTVLRIKSSNWNLLTSTRHRGPGLVQIASITDPYRTSINYVTRIFRDVINEWPLTKISWSTRGRLLSSPFTRSVYSQTSSFQVCWK